MDKKKMNCANLQKFTNACDIYPCVDKVEGIASNSDSPTDT